MTMRTIILTMLTASAFLATSTAAAEGWIEIRHGAVSIDSDDHSNGAFVGCYQDPAATVFACGLSTEVMYNYGPSANVVSDTSSDCVSARVFGNPYSGQDIGEDTCWSWGCHYYFGDDVRTCGRQVLVTGPSAAPGTDLGASPCTPTFTPEDPHTNCGVSGHIAGTEFWAYGQFRWGQICRTVKVGTLSPTGPDACYGGDAPLVAEEVPFVPIPEEPELLP